MNKKGYILTLYFVSFVNVISAQHEKDEFRKIANDPTLLLQNLIQYPSLSYQENPVGVFLENICLERGLYTTIFTNCDSSFNFAASLYPLNLNKPNIILTSHLDVVPIDNEDNWRHPPFSGKIIGDTIWGRGSIDCKGLAVMQLNAIFDLVALSKEVDLPYNVTFLGLSNEENSGLYGAPMFVEYFWEDLNAVVVYGEGGSGLKNIVPSKPDLEVFGISVAEKSSLWLRLDVNTKTTGHGAVPTELYANKRLLKCLIKLMDEKRELRFNKLSNQMFRDLGTLEGGVKGYVIKHINWLVFWPFVKKYFKEGEIFNVFVQNTFVITSMHSIHTGSPNQIGSEAFATLDCRLLPGTNVKKFIKKVQGTVGPKIKVSVIAESPNTVPSKKTFYFDKMQIAIKKLYPNSVATEILFPASTDNNYFRIKGVPTYGIIPAVLTNEALEGVHGSNEYMLISDMNKGIAIYKHLLDELMSK